MIVPRFTSIADYARCFNDAAYWRPYVREICRRHGLAPAERIEAGLPGTFPVLIVDRQYVVKLFGAQFDGLRRYELEQTVYGLLRAAPRIAAPRLLGCGRLFPDEQAWSWPYVIVSVIPGRSLGEDRAAVTYADQLAAAAWLGRQAGAMYALELPASGELRPDWAAFADYLRQRRAECCASHLRWGSLPRRMIQQIPAYLPPIEALIDSSTPPRLLHCDLNHDHVLGVFDGAHWRPTGLIDFGDAMAGDPAFDLVALHMGLAYGDKRLLGAFLAASGTQLHLRPDFARRAMSYTLLFEHDVLSDVLSREPALRELPGLPELASRIWALDAA